MSQPRWPLEATLPSLQRRTSVGALAGAAGGATLGGMALSAHPLTVVALAAIATFAVISWSKPRLAVASGLFLMALPYTWSPTLFSVVVAPALAISAIWICVSVAQGRYYFSWHPIDLAVAGLVLAPAISSVAVGYSFSLFWFTIANVALPYAAVRLYLSADDRRVVNFVPPALVGVGCAVAVLAFAEVILGHNPTTHVFTNPDLTRWTLESTRSGFVRAQASFGHPIALGAFLLLPLALAAAWPRKHLRWALLMLIPAVLLTFSRGPWVGLVLILILVLVTERSIRGRLPTVVGLVVLIAGIAWFFGPVRDVIQLTSVPGTVEAGNATYRSHLLTAAFEHVSLVGTPLPQSQTNELLPEFKDLTSTLVLTLLRTGVLGLSALFALAFFAVRSLVRAIVARDGYLRAISIAVIAQLVVLVDVALITNYQYMFWLSVAFLAVYEGDRRRRAAEGVDAASGESPPRAT